jgi:hypothetical protein
MWDDLKIAIQHFTAFEKVAVVTDVFGVKEAMMFFGVLVRCPIKIFPDDELPATAAWVNE